MLWTVTMGRGCRQSPAGLLSEDPVSSEARRRLLFLRMFSCPVCKWTSPTPFSFSSFVVWSNFTQLYSLVQFLFYSHCKGSGTLNQSKPNKKTKKILLKILFYRAICFSYFSHSVMIATLSFFFSFLFRDN